MMNVWRSVYAMRRKEGYSTDRGSSDTYPKMNARRKEKIPNKIVANVSFDERPSMRDMITATEKTVSMEIRPKTPVRKFPRKSEAMRVKNRMMGMDIRIFRAITVSVLDCAISSGFCRANRNPYFPI